MSDHDDEVTVEVPTLPDAVLRAAAAAAGTTALTDAQVYALIPRLPWERSQEHAMRQVVTDLLQPRGDDE